MCGQAREIQAARRKCSKIGRIALLPSLARQAYSSDGTRSCACYLLAFDSVLFDLTVERRAAQAQELGGVGNAAAGALQSFVDQLALPEVDAERFKLVAGTAGVAEAKIIGQDDVALTHDDGTVDHVAELADIAGPRVAEELFAGVG